MSASVILPGSINLRSDPVGGVPRAAPYDWAAAVHSSRLILLVHGFNDSAAQATEAYSAFIEKQKSLAPDAYGGNFCPGWVVVPVYWVGDGRGGPFFYPDAVPNAIESAHLLLDALSRLASPTVLIQVIAHSLGARLVVEAINAAAGVNTKIVFQRVVFFSAAIPTFRLEDAPLERGTDLRSVLGQQLGEAALSLYSTADPVLAFAFPPGQTLAVPHELEGCAPTALGHRLWSPSQGAYKLSQSEVIGANHSAYWGWEPKMEAQADIANREVRTFLRFASRPLGSVSERMPPIYNAAEARDPTVRNLVTRSVTGRTLTYGGH